MNGRLDPLGIGNHRLEGRWHRLAIRVRRPLGRRLQLREGKVALLAQLARESARPVGRGTAAGPRVLVAMLRNWTAHTAYEAVIAQALHVRGAEVALVTCGGGQPLCEVGWSRRLYPLPCDRCAYFTSRLGAASRLPVYRLASGFPWGADARRAPEFVEGASPGLVNPRQAAEISASWLLRTPALGAEPEGGAVLDDLAVSAVGIEQAISSLLDRFRPDGLFLLNGLFAAERVMRDVALARGVRVTTYEIAPREGALVFSHEAPAPLYDTSAAWIEAQDRPLLPSQAAALDQLLEDRAQGVGAHERYFGTARGGVDDLRQELGLPPGARVVALYTNLAWDSAVLDRDIAYPSMVDWVVAAVEAAAQRPELVLVVRVHPAEVRWGTRQPVGEVLAARIGRLPANVRVVGPDVDLSSYELLRLSTLALTYASTIGLEAAVRSVPVAVAAATHYRGRGFTIDVDNHDDLLAALDGVQSISEDQVELARRYAFTFFFRSMIPFPAVRIEDGLPVEVPTAVERLLPGRDVHLDFVCERILAGGRFTLPDELTLPAVVP